MVGVCCQTVHICRAISGVGPIGFGRARSRFGRDC